LITVVRAGDGARVILRDHVRGVERIMIGEDCLAQGGAK
jgi:hypothetical protein